MASHSLLVGTGAAGSSGSSSAICIVYAYVGMSSLDSQLSRLSRVESTVLSSRVSVCLEQRAQEEEELGGRGEARAREGPRPLRRHARTTLP